VSEAAQLAAAPVPETCAGLGGTFVLYILDSGDAVRRDAIVFCPEHVKVATRRGQRGHAAWTRRQDMHDGLARRDVDGVERLRPISMLAISMLAANVGSFRATRQRVAG
jgi:hypothetical protein